MIKNYLVFQRNFKSLRLWIRPLWRPLLVEWMIYMMGICLTHLPHSRGATGLLVLLHDHPHETICTTKSIYSLFVCCLIFFCDEILYDSRAVLISPGKNASVPLWHAGLKKRTQSTNPCWTIQPLWSSRGIWLVGDTVLHSRGRDNVMMDNLKHHHVVWIYFAVYFLLSCMGWSSSWRKKKEKNKKQPSRCQ